MDLYKNEVFLDLVKAGKCDMNDKELVTHLTACNPVPPRLGFNWFYILPRVKTNFRRLENTTMVFDISWLCYNLSLCSHKWLWERKER